MDADGKILVKANKFLRMYRKGAKRLKIRSKVMISSLLYSVIKKCGRANQVQGEESVAEQNTLGPDACFPLCTSALHFMQW